MSLSDWTNKIVPWCVIDTQPNIKTILICRFPFFQKNFSFSFYQYPCCESRRNYGAETKHPLPLGLHRTPLSCRYFSYRILLLSDFPPLGGLSEELPFHDLLN